MVDSLAKGSSTDRHGWRYLATYLFRRTGFPFELLERFSFPESNEVAGQLAALADDAERVGQQICDEVHRLVGATEDHALRRALLNLRKRIAKLRDPLPADLELVSDNNLETLGELLDAYARARAAQADRWVDGADVFEAELRKMREALREVAEDTRFREAVFLSNPHFYYTGLHHYLRKFDVTRRPSKIRAIERKLLLYLQRFCAKNETTSFFGPVTYGRLDAGAERVLSYEQSSTLIGRREVFFSHWAIRQIASEISVDPRVAPSIPVRRNPLARLTGSGAFVALLEREFPLDDIERALMRDADGHRTVTELARDHGLSIDECLALLNRMQSRMLVTCNIDIPADLFRPLRWLIRWLEGNLSPDNLARAEWLERLAALENGARRFEAASFPSRLEQWQELQRLYTELNLARGGEARRGGGHYSDREVVFEDCLSGMTGLSLGGDLVRTIQHETRPLLDIDAARGKRRRDAYQQACQALASTLEGTERPLSYSRLVRALARNGARGIARLDLSELESLEQHLLSSLAAGRAPLAAADPELDFLRRQPVVGSPDISIAAESIEAIERGDYLLVMGETQSFIGAWGYGRAFHPAPEELLDEVNRLLSGCPQREALACFTIAHDSKIKGFEYPGKSIEFRARSTKPPEDVIPLAQLAIEESTDGLALIDGLTGDEVVPYCGVSDAAEELCFGATRLLHGGLHGNGRFTPRLTVGKVVYQRATWRFSGNEIPRLDDPKQSGLELLFSFHRWREQHGIPRFAFVVLDTQTKPLLVDFRNVFSLEAFCAKLSKSSRAVVSEMLPGPDDLWLRDGAGRYTSEFRFSVANETITEYEPPKEGCR